MAFEEFIGEGIRTTEQPFNKGGKITNNVTPEIDPTTLFTRLNLKFRGLVQNRPLRSLTHHELINAFKNTGYKLSNHAVAQLKNIRLKKLGFETLNDVKHIFNKGSIFDAGKGDIGLSLRVVEVIINPKTNNIITIRPAKNR